MESAFEETPATDQAGEAALKQRCAAWLNLSSFFARVIAAGLFDGYDDWAKYPSVDIPIGLGLSNKWDQGPALLRECRILVATQYLTGIGSMLHADMVEANVERWSKAVWDTWRDKLREIEEEEGLSDKVKSEVSQALKRMDEIDANGAEQSGG
jgi:hypothetical protein